VSADLWRDLLTLQGKVRDYVRVLGLELIVDESEGYAYCGSWKKARKRASLRAG
jgi:hypothetical protein